MSVRVIAVTEPKINFYGEHSEYPMSVEEFIAYVARVSNPSNQNNTLTATKLLRYLAKNKHWSPFEQVNVVMEINTTRDIVRQILRHRSFSFQEFSQRYADPTQLGFILKEARLQDAKNRQNSVELDNTDFNDSVLKFKWAQEQVKVRDAATNAYKWAIQNGIAKEVARVVLPEGNTASRLFMNGTLRSWIHYCDLRMKNGTQKEHREVAVEAWELILKIFPSLSEVLIND
jgi:thymidylate synthase (FAD)